MSDQTKPRLLVVDDEPDMLDFLERVLRRRFQVIRCGNGEAALEALESERFEVLITDQKMPRMSGIQLLERIRDDYPKLLRLILSGFTEVSEIEHAITRCGIHGYILKPVDSRRLLQAIDDAYEVRAGKVLEPPTA